MPIPVKPFTANNDITVIKLRVGLVLTRGFAIVRGIYLTRAFFCDTMKLQIKVSFDNVCAVAES